MTQIKPPPHWLSEWLQLLAVQVVALGLLIGGAWKKLMKPYKSQDIKLKKRQGLLYKKVNKSLLELKQSDFDLRTDVDNYRRIVVDSDKKMDEVLRRLASVNSFEDSMHEELADIREKLEIVQKDIATVRQDVAFLKGRSKVEGQ